MVGGGEEGLAAKGGVAWVWAAVAGGRLTLRPRSLAIPRSPCRLHRRLLFSHASLRSLAFPAQYPFREHFAPDKVYAVLTDPHTVTAPQAAAFAAVLLVLYAEHRRRKAALQQVMMLDFEAWGGNEMMKISRWMLMEGMRRCGWYSEESLAFQQRVLLNAGLSNETYFPPGLTSFPTDLSMEAQRAEMEEVMFRTVEDLLSKTRIDPREIDILVVSCSMFAPEPSLASMVVNRFGMRWDIDSYSIGGMGCSVGVVGAGLVAKLLREKATRTGKPGLALVVTTECLLANVYQGERLSMQVPNALFRMGGAATVYTNRPKDRKHAKYDLKILERRHFGADATAYGCAFRHEDEKGVSGMDLSPELVHVAARALKSNLASLGQKMLPLSEKIAFAVSFVAFKLNKKYMKEHYEPYTPDFKSCFDHFCLHAGGRAVVDKLASQLDLDDRRAEPAANALYWYGNTSSATIFYSLGYIEQFQGVKRGDIVWQFGIGSGFKCNSAIWKARRPIDGSHRAWFTIANKTHEALAHFKVIKERSRAMREARAAARTEEREHSPPPPRDVKGIAEAAMAIARERASRRVPPEHFARVAPPKALLAIDDKANEKPHEHVRTSDGKRRAQDHGVISPGTPASSSKEDQAELNRGRRRRRGGDK